MCDFFQFALSYINSQLYMASLRAINFCKIPSLPLNQNFIPCSTSVTYIFNDASRLLQNSLVDVTDLPLHTEKSSRSLPPVEKLHSCSSSLNPSHPLPPHLQNPQHRQLTGGCDAQHIGEPRQGAASGAAGALARPARMCSCREQQPMRSLARPRAFPIIRRARVHSAKQPFHMLGPNLVSNYSACSICLFSTIVLYLFCCHIFHFVCHLHKCINIY